MKYACKVDLPNAAKETIFAGAKMATYVDVFDIHKAVNRNEVFAYLPAVLQNKKKGIHVVNMDFDRGVDELWTHKHLKEKCVLNIYFKTNDEETIFYEGEEIEMFDSNANTRSGSTRFFKKLLPDTLHKVESFVAKANECWLLKTSQPHSVLSNKKTGTRTLLQVYFFENTYEEVVEMFGVSNDNL